MANAKWLVCFHFLLLAATSLNADKIPVEEDYITQIQQGASVVKRACAHKCNKICYDPVEQQCCNGIILNGFFSCSDCKKEKKCGDRCYPVTGYKCCYNKVIPNQGWKCCAHHCGSTCYTAETEKCCDNKIISRSKACCIKPVDSCGNNCYDKKFAKCCNGQIIGINAKCCKKCEGKCYNPGNQQCCHSKIISKSQTCCKSGEGVCGKACFKPPSQKCCHGRIMGSGQTCCNPGEGVCGKSCYKPPGQKCCHGRIMGSGQTCCNPGEGVCGKACFKPPSQKCCHGRIMGSGQTCCNPGEGICGKACFNGNSQKCCHGKVINKAQTCCKPGDIACGRRIITTGVYAKHIGCYKDTWNRAIPTLEGKDRLLVGPYRSRKYAIEKCALAAARRGWKYFAVQHQGWCASSQTAGGTYNKYGRYHTCRNGKGGPWGNDVYILEGAAAKKTTGGEICVFPFIYKGERYVDCTTRDHGRPWCSVTPNYDVDKLRGDCPHRCPIGQRLCGIHCYNSAFQRCCPGNKIGNKWGGCFTGWWRPGGPFG